MSTTKCESCESIDPRHFVLITSEGKTAKGFLCQACLDALSEYADDPAREMKVGVLNHREFSEIVADINGEWSKHLFNV